MIKISQLQLKVGDFPLKSPHDLVYSEGNLHFIKGASGAGKTSFLYVLGLISSQSNYHYHYNNKLITSDNQKEKIRKSDIGFLYQNFNIQKELTLYQNLNLFCMIKGKKISEHKATSLLETVGLNKSLSTLTKNLSGGQLQRFCLACILAKDPKVIIADEPTSALDKETAYKMMMVLKSLATKNNKTVIVSTHSQAYDDLADSIDIIQNHAIIRTKNYPSKDTVCIHNSNLEKIDFHFYLELLKSRLKFRIIKQMFPIFLALIILSLCAYLSFFGQNVQNDYKTLISSTQTSEYFLTPSSPQWLSENDYLSIQKNKNIKSINEVKKVMNASIEINGQTYSNIEVFPLFDFQKGYQLNTMLVSPNFSDYVGQIGTINIGGIEIDLEITEEVNLRFLNPYQATANCVFIPYDYLMTSTALFTGIYVVDYKNSDQIQQLKDQIENLSLAYNVISPYQEIENALLSLYTQIDLVLYSTYILYAISFIMLVFISFQDILSKRQELSIYQANGLIKRDIFKLECIENCIRFIFYFMIILIITQFYLFLGNNYILLNIIHIRFNYSFFHRILILLVLFDFLPRIISVIWLLKLSLEKELRSV